jgi:hypothetical protein
MKRLLSESVYYVLLLRKNRRMPYREKRYLPLSKVGMSRRINLQNTNITKISWIYNLETKITAELKDKL